MRKLLTQTTHLRAGGTSTHGALPAELGILMALHDGHDQRPVSRGNGSFDLRQRFACLQLRNRIVRLRRKLSLMYFAELSSKALAPGHGCAESRRSSAR